MSNLFIPTKLRVGFQERNDTYTKRLAYVIYYDAKGKIRKEQSWNSWIDKKIKPEEYDNAPTEGFVLNKGIRRYNWSHFSSNRSMIRVYDPRNFEFEITPENLLAILTETDCSRRGFDGKFVYAWQGTELVLLPCVSEEYRSAVEHTKRQSLKISARDLKPGCSYTTKKGEEVIYLGRFDWFTWYQYDNQGRTKKKVHVFCYPEKPKYDSMFFHKKDATFLASLNNPDPVPNYPHLMSKWEKEICSSEIEKWETTPVAEWNPDRSQGRSWYSYTDHFFAKPSEHVEGFVFWRISRVRNYCGSVNPQHPAKYTLQEVGVFYTKTCTVSNERLPEYNYSSYGGKSYTASEIREMLSDFVNVYAVLKNGVKVKVLYNRTGD